MAADTRGATHDALVKAASAIRDAFNYDPGHSDLDNEQPIHISTTLGAWRRLNHALFFPKHAAELDANGTRSETEEKSVWRLRAEEVGELGSQSPRPCTCHPDDNPPVPCPKKYALDECRKAHALYWSARPSAPSAAAGNSDDPPFRCDAWSRRAHKCAAQCDGCFRREYEPRLRRAETLLREFVTTCEVHGITSDKFFDLWSDAEAARVYFREPSVPRGREVVQPLSNDEIAAIGAKVPAGRWYTERRDRAIAAAAAQAVRSSAAGIDAEAITWALGKLEAFGLQTKTENALMMDRLKLMVLDSSAPPAAALINEQAGPICLPVKLYHWNTPMGDTGDYEGHTAIKDDEGTVLCEWYDADEKEEAIADQIVKMLNGTVSATAFGTWQLIASAPKDADAILVSVPFDDENGGEHAWVTAASWDEGWEGAPDAPAYEATWVSLMTGDHIKPSHWMPLPNAADSGAPAK